MSTKLAVLPEPDVDETGPYCHLGFAEAKPGYENTVEKLILDLVEPLRAEPGAIEFHVHRDRTEPRLFVIYEVFRSKKDLEEHITQPYTQEFIQKIQSCVTGPLRQQFLRMCSELPATRVGKG
ncbi:putative quinol monooxygenase [Amycolatopsis sp. NPDC049868]|uniref:putative quinol monooxygenase n=1 Tax=Amycolatopsis sp. NPDC049868 TaxID=3363934 RepID=UPI0037ACE623